jgi:hypothetical protein
VQRFDQFCTGHEPLRCKEHDKRRYSRVCGAETGALEKGRRGSYVENVKTTPQIPSVAAIGTGCRKSGRDLLRSLETLVGHICATIFPSGPSPKL